MSAPFIDVDLRSTAFKDDPLPTWHRLQAAGDVVVTRVPLLGKVAFATRRDACRRVLEEPAAFSVDARRVGRRARAGTQWWVPKSFARLADNLLAREGDEHRGHRRRVDTAFRKPALEGLQERIDARCESCLDALERASAQGAGHDFVRSVARPLPMGVIGDLLGLDPRVAEPDAPLGRALARLSGIAGPGDLFRLLPAIRTVARAMRAELHARQRSPRGDFLGVLAESMRDDEADGFDEDAAVSMVFLLYVAGHETTTHLLSGAVLELLRRPGMREAWLDATPAQGTAELMRWLSPVQFAKPRFVVRDVEIGGAVLRRGSTISALIGAANMDDRVYDAPHRPDFARAPVRHLGFGAGPHVCLGLQLAARETDTVLRALFERFPNVALADTDALPDWTERAGLRALASLPLSLNGRA